MCKNVPSHRVDAVTMVRHRMTMVMTMAQVSWQKGDKDDVSATLDASGRGTKESEPFTSYFVLLLFVVVVVAVVVGVVFCFCLMRLLLLAARCLLAA